MARQLWCIFDTRQLGPSTRVLKNFLSCRGRVHGSPVSTTRVDGPSWRVSKMYPSWRAVNSARELGKWTLVVETGLKSAN